MKRYTIQFESSPVSGQEDAFNLWYDAVHVPDMLSVPGFQSCQRYKVVSEGIQKVHYIAAYEVDTENPGELVASLFSQAGEMDLSPALDLESVGVTILERLG